MEKAEERAAEGATPQDAAQDAAPQDPREGEGAGAPQDPEGGEGKGTETVNRHQYERDVQRRDREIADLRARLKEATDAKAADGDETARLRQELDGLKAQLADERVTASLAAAGCIDPKAAKARLPEFEGDVARLAEAAPYLFRREDRTTRGTGGVPAGGASDADEARMRRLAGLPPRK